MKEAAARNPKNGEWRGQEREVGGGGGERIEILNPILQSKAREFEKGNTNYKD